MPARKAAGGRGAISRSTMLPCTFMITREEEVLAKAFCASAIITSPAPRNWM
jgi:hypothetical protein